MLLKFGEKKLKIQIDMSKLYLYNSVEIVSKACRQIIVSISRGSKQKMLLKRIK